MSRLLVYLILLLLTGCTSVPGYRLNKCYYQGEWSFPKFAKQKERIYKESWRQGSFSSSNTNFIDLAKNKKFTNFSCHKISRMNVRLYKTWQDVLWNFIPFYYSTHVEVSYTSL